MIGGNRKIKVQLGLTTKKAFDSVLYEWILKVLKNFKVITCLKCNIERGHTNLWLIHEKDMLKINHLNINNEILEGHSISFFFLYSSNTFLYWI